MKVSDVIINCLEAEGVEYVFGIVGTEMLDLAHSLAKSTQIQYVNVRHEQGAAFMADVYGRLAKKAGCLFIHIRSRSDKSVNRDCQCKARSFTPHCTDRAG